MKNMKEMKRKSVGCYVRVSTISQDIDKFSINGQITQIKEYCQQGNYELLYHNKSTPDRTKISL